MHYDERHESRWVPRLKKWSYVDTKELESSNKGEMDDEENFLKIAEENFTAYYRWLIQWVLFTDLCTQTFQFSLQCHLGNVTSTCLKSPR
jgi:hypothetical protein